MSAENEKGKTPTLESVTAEREEMAKRVGALEKDLAKAKGDAEASTRAKVAAERELGETKAALTQAEKARDDYRDLYNDAMADATSDRALPDLIKTEPEGTRHFGRETTGERFVHVERIDFSQDQGYVATAVHRRAKAAVERALGGNENELPGLPPFDEGRRSLTVVVEIA